MAGRPGVLEIWSRCGHVGVLDFRGYPHQLSSCSSPHRFTRMTETSVNNTNPVRDDHVVAPVKAAATGDSNVFNGAYGLKADDKGGANASDKAPTLLADAADGTKKTENLFHDTFGAPPWLVASNDTGAMQKTFDATPPGKDEFAIVDANGKPIEKDAAVVKVAMAENGIDVASANAIDVAMSKDIIKKGSAEEQLSLARELELIKGIEGPRRKILEAAFKNFGTKAWSRSEHADKTVNGQYGCAAAEGVVLGDAGYRLNQPTVKGAVDELKRRGWTQVPYDQRQPGDAMVGHESGKAWQRGGGLAHMGIVGADKDYVYTNDSASAKWVYRTMAEKFDRFPVKFVMRPPKT